MRIADTITDELRECTDPDRLAQLVNDLIQAGHIGIKPTAGIAFEGVSPGDLVLIRQRDLRTVAQRENPFGTGPYGSSWVRIRTDQGDSFVGRTHETVHKYDIS